MRRVDLDLNLNLTARSPRCFFFLVHEPVRSLDKSEPKNTNESLLVVVSRSCLSSRVATYNFIVTGVFSRVHTGQVEVRKKGETRVKPFDEALRPVDAMGPGR